jgi:hypothetical protein
MIVTRVATHSKIFIYLETCKILEQERWSKNTSPSVDNPFSYRDTLSID